MNNLVIIPFHDFKVALNEGFCTRDTHLYENFINNDKIDNVIIINRPTSLIEILLNRKKLITIKESIIYKNNFCYIQEYKKGVYILDFLVFDFFNVIIKKHSWLPEIYSRKKIVDSIKDSLNFLKINQFSVYMSMPFSVKLGLSIGANTKILDAVDNFAKYENWSYFRNTINSLYNTAKAHYDIIYVNSQDTFDYLKNDCKAELILQPNGADHEIFSKDYERPSDLPNKFTVGYAGKIQVMFNTELLVSIAKKHPNINFVLLGKFLDKKWKKNHWDKLVKEIPNIIFLGHKKYDTLPAYYNNFDVCIIPYSIKNQHGGDPIKFYEYMICKKPIISTNIGNISKFNNNESIFICNTNKEFEESFEKILKNIKYLKTDYILPEDITWKAISNTMVNKVFKNEKN